MLSLRNRSFPPIAASVCLMIAIPCGEALAQTSSDASEGNDQAQCMSDPVCKAHFTRARKLSKSDDFEGALAAYQAAYRRREAPWLLVNMGRTLQKLGRPKEAVELFERFLSSGTEDAVAREKAQQFLREAQQEVLNLPPAPVNAPQRVKREPSPSTVPSEPVQDSEPVKRAEPVEAARPQLVETPSVVTRSKWRSPLFLTGACLGGSVALAGVVTGSLALSTASTLRNSPYLGDPGTPQRDLQQRAQSLAIATDVLLPVGLIAVGSAILATALHRPREPVAAAQARSAPLVIPTPVSVDVKSKPDPEATAPHPSQAAGAAPPADANGNPSQRATPVEGTESAPASPSSPASPAAPVVPSAPSASPAVSGTISLSPSLGVGRDGFAVSVAGSF